jgi:hypothetical protein
MSSLIIVEIVSIYYYFMIVNYWSSSLWFTGLKIKTKYKKNVVCGRYCLAA